MGRVKMTFLLLLVVCTRAAQNGEEHRTVRRSLSSWTNCLNRHRSLLLSYNGRCAATQLGFAYGRMILANCKNCDKYFHCIGNYWAMNECNNSDETRRAAEVISDCREWGDNSRDASRDQEANLYGRNGGDCSVRFLAPENCAYNPSTKVCAGNDTNASSYY
ncbi:uncharacterized protein LOC144103799 [Amblyomma americanum]